MSKDKISELQEQLRKLQVKHAAELSILDQEITSLKAKNKYPPCACSCCGYTNPDMKYDYIKSIEQSLSNKGSE